MNKRSLFSLLALIIILTNFSMAQTIDAEFKKKANEYYTNSDWDNSIKMYSEIVAADDKNLQAWNRLSLCYINKKDYDKAFEVLETGVTKGDNYFMLYNLSCLYSKKGMKDKSLSTLRKAIATGYANSEAAINDEYFASMKNDKDFLAIIEEMKRVEFPCQYNERLKEFSFWVGEWDVFTTLGGKAGESKIEKILNQCVIMENWTNTGGRKGKSFNVINSNTGDWEQTWVDDSGNITEFKKGKFENNALSFIAEGKDQNNKQQYQRLTFYRNDDGTVRQLGEFSSNGKDWQVSYDLLYKKK